MLGTSKDPKYSKDSDGDGVADEVDDFPKDYAWGRGLMYHVT